MPKILHLTYLRKSTHIIKPGNQEDEIDSPGQEEIPSKPFPPTQDQSMNEQEITETGRNDQKIPIEKQTDDDQTVETVTESLDLLKCPDECYSRQESLEQTLSTTRTSILSSKIKGIINYNFNFNFKI